MSMTTLKVFLILFECLPGLFTTGIVLFLVVLFSRVIYVVLQADQHLTSPKLSDPEQRRNERKMDFFESVLDELHALGGANMCCGFSLKSKSSLSYDHVYNALKCVTKKYPMLRTVIVNKRDRDDKPVKYLRVLDEINKITLIKLDVQDWVPVWEEEVQTKFDCERGPLWRATLLQERYDTAKEQYHNTILFTFYHGTIDGMAVLRFVRELLKCLENTTKGVLNNKDDINTTSTGILPGVMTLLASKQFFHFKVMQWLLPKSILVHLVKFAMRVNLMFDVKNPIIYAGNSANAVGNRNEKIKIIPRQLSIEQTRKLIKFCRMNCCTVYGFMLACCHLAVAKLLREGKTKETNASVQFGWYCPVNVRAQCQPRVHEDDLGAFTTVLMENVVVPRMNTADSNKFWNFVKRCTREVHSGIRNGRHLLSLYLLPISHLLDSKEFVSEFILHSRMNQSELMSPAHSLTNLGRIDWSKAKDDIYEVESVSGGSGAYRHGATFVNHMATFNGVFTWSTSYITSRVSEKTAEEYVHLVFETLLDGLLLSNDD